MATHIIRQSVEANGARIEKQLSYSGAAAARIDGEAIGAAGTTQLVFTIDVSAVKSFFIVSSVDAILETNSSSAADDTINLLAGVPYIWNTQSYDAFLLGTDVTSLFFTVAGAVAGVVNCEVLSDPTP